MSKAVNKCIFIGNVGRDPDIRTTGSGAAIANFSLAVNDRQKDSQGNWQDHVEWVNLVAFGKIADVVRSYVGKGDKLYVEGKLQTRNWDDKQTGEKHYKAEVVVNELVLLSGKDEKSDSPAPSKSTAYPPKSSMPVKGAKQEPLDEEVPF